MIRNNYWPRNLIGPYRFWVISPRNSTSFTGLFLAGRWRGLVMRLGVLSYISSHGAESVTDWRPQIRLQNSTCCPKRHCSLNDLVSRGQLSRNQLSQDQLSRDQFSRDQLKINSYLFKSNQQVSDNYIKSVTNVHIQSLITKSCVIFHCFYVVIQSFSLECHPSTWLLVRGPLKLK